MTAKEIDMATTVKRNRVPREMERYTVAIDDLVIVIETDRDGGYLVTCPFDPELYTHGRTLDEAVKMAKDAKKTLVEARAKKPAKATASRIKHSAAKATR